jgi:hypothetical protein
MIALSMAPSPSVAVALSISKPCSSHKVSGSGTLLSRWTNRRNVGMAHLHNENGAPQGADSGVVNGSVRGKAPRGAAIHDHAAARAKISHNGHAQSIGDFRGARPFDGAMFLRSRYPYLSPRELRGRQGLGGLCMYQGLEPTRRRLRLLFAAAAKGRRPSRPRFPARSLSAQP